MGKRKPSDDFCVWMQSEDGQWDTSCGKTWEFNDAGPEENGANYCHHCGCKLLPEPFESEPAGAKIERSEGDER